MNIKKDVDLSHYTTFHIGGRAKYFTPVSSEEELIETLRWAKRSHIDSIVLGEGSNVLISSRGFEGLIIKMGIKGISRKGNRVTCGAGEKLDKLVSYCVDNQLQGMECLSGIPGSVGGSVVQNAGAFGQEISETLEEVHTVDTSTFESKILKKKGCKFSYRASILKNNHTLIVTTAVFTLSETPKAKIVFESLKKDLGEESDIRTIRETVLKERKLRSSFYDKNDPNSISAGCFFANPVIGKVKFDAIKKKFPDIPFWETKKGIKLSAGWMVEKVGFKRGYTEGKVGLSEKHSLIVINKGEATSFDIEELADKINTKVALTFSIRLEPEITFIN